MTEKHREYLKNKIKELGLYGTSDLLGLSMAQLIVISGIEITTKYANEVLLDMIDKEDIPTRYKGFDISHNGEGGVSWYGGHLTDIFGPKLQETIYCMATPFWDGKNMVPIDFDFYNLATPSENSSFFSYDSYGLYESIITVREEFESLEKLLEWYRDFYLPTVYDKIMNECLPEVRKHNEDEIIESIEEYFN